MKILMIVMGALLMVATAGAEGKTGATSRPFGKMPDGTSVEIYTLKDASIEAQIMTYGGILVSLKVPDRSGKPADIVLGFDDLTGYVSNSNNKGTAFFGALIGRYANRIAHATFTLDGKKYDVPRNDGENSLHGGPHGFNNVVWKARGIKNGVELTYVSRDGEAGYPGTLTAVVTYTLIDSSLRIEYSATTDKDTVLNLTNHSYFNLTGNAADVLGHQLTLHASRFTPVDAMLIPTGELKSVASTPFDFRKATAIGAGIDGADEQLQRGHGYDHNWVLDHANGKLAEAAVLYDSVSGRVLRVLTDQPGIQFYSGNFLDGTIKGKGGVAYQHRTGVCLETQHFPDSPNHPSFPSTELKPGKKFHSVTVFNFSSR